MKFSSEVEKCIMLSSVQVLPNQVSKKSFYTFEDSDLRESHAKLLKEVRNPWNFNGFLMYFAVFIYRNEYSLSFKINPYQKILAKYYL